MGVRLACTVRKPGAWIQKRCYGHLLAAHSVCIEGYYCKCSHRHVFLHLPAKFCSNRTIGGGVMKSYRFFRTATIESEIYFRLKVWWWHLFKKGKSICIPNFDEISQSTAEIRLLPVSENGRQKLPNVWTKLNLVTCSEVTNVWEWVWKIRDPFPYNVGNSLKLAIGVIWWRRCDLSATVSSERNTHIDKLKKNYQLWRVP